jgi:hypothetical protein
VRWRGARSAPWTIALAGLLFLVLNVLGLAAGPSFDLHCASLLASLITGFALFADVAIAED